MARDRQSWYLTWGGLIGDEIWQTGVHFAMGAAVPVPVPTQADVDGIYPLVKNYFANSGSHISKECELGWVRIARQDPAGAEMEEAKIKESTDYTPGGAPEPAGPFQVSLVLSLRTNTTFGRANYGRCYIPGLYSQYLEGKYAFINYTDHAARFRVMLNEINTYLQTEVGETGIATFAASNLSAVGSGATKKITKVLVGDVPDTQRRRRNALKETYTQFPLS